MCYASASAAQAVHARGRAGGVRKSGKVVLWRQAVIAGSGKRRSFEICFISEMNQTMEPRHKVGLLDFRNRATSRSTELEPQTRHASPKEYQAQILSPGRSWKAAPNAHGKRTLWDRFWQFSAPGLSSGSGLPGWVLGGRPECTWETYNLISILMVLCSGSDFWFWAARNIVSQTSRTLQTDLPALGR